ncbi:MAG: ATP-binding cassette domain-containing protein [Deltaproteobacteria bacterium]|nr:ATP-binding cassette domain-containing protein [Deltaproteobacteria bacterium]
MAEIDRVASAIEFLALGAGLEVDPAAVRRAVREARGGAPSADASDLLEVAAPSAGLRVVERSLSVREVASVGGGPHAVFVLLGPKGWVFVLGRKGHRLRVAEFDGEPGEGRWVSEEELCVRLGAVNPSSPVTSFAGAPVAPLEAVSAHHDGNGASPVKRLLRLLALDRDDLGVVFVYAFAVGVLSLATPIAVQALVNSVAFGAVLQPVVVLSILVLAVLAFAALLRGLQVRVVEALQQRLFVRVALDLAYRLPRVQAQALDEVYGPEFVNRFFDVLTVQKTAATFLLDGVGLLLQAAIGLVVLGFYHPALLAFDVTLTLVVAVILVVLGKGAPKTSIEESKAKYAVAGWLEELVRHPYVFRAAQPAELAAERAEALTRRYLGARRAHFGILVRQVLGLLWLQAIASAALLGIGGALVVDRQLTLGQLVAAELIVSAVVASLVKLGKHFESFYDLVAAVDKLGHLADLPLESGSSVRATVGDPRGARVSLHGASVSYREGVAASPEVTLALEPGARAVVTGECGSGKTSLAELTFGLRLPSSGSVSVDGLDTREASLTDLRDRAALVGALPEVFDGTVAENVAAGRIGVGPREVSAALRTVGLDVVVRSLPEGAATRLSPSGAPLSNGQARRLAFARAIAGKPRLLVVDDALAALDSRSRELVEAALLAPEAPWTLLAFTAPDDPFCSRPGVQRVFDLGDGSPNGAHRAEVSS